MALKHFETPVIAAHWGGINCCEGVLKRLCGKNIFFDTSFGYSMLPKYYAEKIIETHGTDKILFGTDTPWHTPEMEMRLLKSLELTTEEMEKITHKNAEKLLNILPTGSVVGVLLYNDNYNVVETDALAFSQHYPVNWKVFGEFFVSGTISNISTQLHENTTVGFENLDPQKVQDAFETVFTNLEKNYSSKFNFSFDEVVKFYRNMKNLDPVISQSIEQTIGTVLKSVAGRQ